ncbi:hypothetical protein [Rubritalea marina]|uniref:hypothetical protein n=1 Tax=Rubritalea marina TaxID=361055 RepID=UPI00035C51CF|nr:hypothetical protein [Rubritalea marina]
MIEIVNGGMDADGKHLYSLYINKSAVGLEREVKVRFLHDRSEGLAACLRAAAEALDERARREGREIIELGPMC